MEAYIRGLERLVEGGGDPQPGRTRSRASSSRASTRRPTSGSTQIGGDARAEGQARDREREARLPELPGGVRGRALGGARGEGRDEAALPLGVDVDEEPRLPRRHVRRGADRPRDREHDARGDDRRLPGSRRGGGDADEGRRRGTEAVRATSPPPASTTTTSSDTLEREGVQKFTDSFARAARRDQRETRRARTGVTVAVAPGARRADLGAGRDASGPARTKTSGSAGSTSRSGCRSGSASSPNSRTGRAPTFDDVRAARHGRLVARAGGAEADVRRQGAARARHDPSGDDPARSSSRST